ncbi:MAG: hypothetical protein NC310_01775 [Roseburia sp.]|nr:hypothetical protein [Anaeroplasma bactoclasticum]MCM1195783.1 hypothetical protein [Roseburia sp.]
MRVLRIKILTTIIMILNCVLIIDKIFNIPIHAEDMNTNEVNEISSSLKATTLGIGGGGMLFDPSISPFDENTMIVLPDMGGMYVSHNAGVNWKRNNVRGIIQKAYFDSNNEKVVYAGGSGLYRSTDNGDTFNLIFPREEEIIERRNCDETTMHYLFTKGNYPTDKLVKDILVNPNDSNNIFVLMYYGKDGVVFESKNNGDSFEEIFTYSKKIFYGVWSGYNKLLYQKETNTLYYSIEDGVFKYDREQGKCTQVYNSELGIVNMAYFQENGKTYFTIIEKTTQLEKFDTKVFYTTDFSPKTTIDISRKIVTRLQDTFDASGYTGVTYNWKFEYIVADSLNNIYVTQNSFSNNSAYPYTIAGIIRFNGEGSTWLYGNPYKNHATSALAEKGWNDGNVAAYGIALSKKNKGAILYTTLCGVYYSPDSEHFYQRYCHVIKEGNSTSYVTNGIDEQTTYGVRINPFNKENILLLNTDLGLIRSEDNGVSWTRAISGIKSTWVNTVYDAAFDKRKENVVYSLWSGRHDMPYEPGNETDGANKRGGFAISNDAGKTWNCEYSKGLPETAIPVKMSIVYPQKNEDELTIYVATMNHGFFVSYDGGKTFTEINDGIERVSYKEGTQYQYILAEDIEAKDGRVFGCTAKSNYNGQVQSGEVFELKNNRWEKIELPSDVQIPRDIYYNNGTLYISATVVRTWDSKDGVAYGSVGGGLYVYKDGEINQIFDKNISVTGVQMDSKGVMYVSDTNGNIYRKTETSGYVKIYDGYHSISKGVQLENDNELYLPTLGGGLLKLEGLESLSESKAGLSQIQFSIIYGIVGVAVFLLLGISIVFIIRVKKKSK